MINIFSILFTLLLFSIDQIEKCSESIGINFVLFLFKDSSIKFHAQIIDSLFAIPIVLLNFIASNVGSKPDKPEIAHII